MHRLLSFFFFLSLCINLKLAYSQDLNRVKTHIDSLCAPYMHGRGYTQGGGQKAANYLAKQFKGIGLKPFGDSYRQPFKMEVNTFPSASGLTIANQSLVLGEDFLPAANSGPGQGTAEIYRLDTAYFSSRAEQDLVLSTNLRNKAVVMPEKFDRELLGLSPTLVRKILEAKILLVSVEKLTHGVATFQLPTVKCYVKANKLVGEIDEVSFNVSPTLLPDYTAQNIVGYVSGTAQPERFLLITAHYDHLGGIGPEVYFPGANDNASGVAMLLELAHAFAENPPPFSVAFIAFGAEEAGLIGSKYYVEQPKFPLEQVEFVLNVDLFATGLEGATVVNGKVFTEAYERLVAINEKKAYLTNIQARGKAANSDHYYFSERGIPAFFLYLRGNWPHYHDIYDAPPVPLSGFRGAFGLLKDFAEAEMMK